MEDTHICSEVDLGNGEQGMLFGVFDGHGGKEVSIYTKRNFRATLVGLEEFKNREYKRALEIAFLKIDE